MPWKIEYKKSVIKTVRKLDPPIRNRLRDLLEGKVAHLEDPRSLGKALAGSDGVWRYRAGDYRILCQIRDAEISVLVIDIGHRSTVYRPR